MDKFIFVNGSRIKNLKGKQFNNLKVNSFSEIKNHYAQWNCKCTCGNKIVVSSYDLISGRKKDCGCKNPPKKKYDYNSFPGMRFGELTIIKLHEIKNKRRIWECLCSCKSICYYPTHTLTRGDVKSCGHLKEVEKIKKTKLGTILNIDKLNKNNTSGVKGVVYNKKVNKWVARIQFMKRVYNLGYYNNLEDAKKIRKIAEEKLHGDFLNWYENEYKKSIDELKNDSRDN